MAGIIFSAFNWILANDFGRILLCYDTRKQYLGYALTTPRPRAFQNAILKWFDEYGRHDLPWQQNPTPYRVWVSEIMLQQTQVTTVIPYYQKFMRTFPSVKSLATAPLDEVLHLWSGLGYYARARNLQACAKVVHEKYHGKFPNEIDKLIELPGIGRSTAGAIASLAMDIHAPILDGNVKRFYARVFAIKGWPGSPLVANQMWPLAEKFLPQMRAGDYNQALMDLGATLCTRSKPKCEQCPVKKYCQAYSLNKISEFPGKKVKAQKPTRSTKMLIIYDEEGRVLLEKRPEYGIWGGLWSFPERALVAESAHAPTIDPIEHIFSHFKLIIYPILLKKQKSPLVIMENEEHIWYKLADPLPGGVAAPIAKLLQRLEKQVLV
jgi:A/G-specific adenine glycosylase